MNKGTVRAISTSRERGKLKTEVPEAILVRDHGIEGDAHTGDWDRQVSCLDWASVLRANALHGIDAGPGDFAENILVEGLDLSVLSRGRRIRIGDGSLLEVSQIGKEDHPSVVSKTFGVSLLPHEGIFCRVIEGGSIKKGDVVELL